MKRLIKEASEMTDVQEKLGVTVDASSMSFDNIVAAIHVVQENMGINGTTAKEASETISGSLASMKSAWQNMLPALIKGGDDFDQCVDNLIDSIVGVKNEAGELEGGIINNLKPAIQKALSGLGRLIEELAPIIEEKLPELVDELLPPLIKAAGALLSGLVKALPSLIKTVIAEIPDLLKQVGLAIAEAFGDQFPFLKKFGEFFAEHGETIAKFIPILIGLVGAFKLFSTIKSFSGLSGIFGKSSGGSGGKSGGIFSGFEQLAKIKPTTILKGMANLAIIIGGFTVMLAAIALVSPLLSKMDMGSTLKIILMLGVLGLVGVALTKFTQIASQMKVTDTLMGIANMAIVVAGMSALFLLVGAVSLIPFDLGRVLGITLILGVLGVVATALSVLAGVLGAVGMVSGGLAVAAIAVGLGMMAIAIAGMTVPLLAIIAISKIDCDLKTIRSVARTILVVGVVGTALSVFAGVVGLIPIPIVLAGITNIGLVLGAMVGLIVAFGKLCGTEGFMDFLDKGGQVLVKLFSILGEIVGAIIGGIGKGLSDALPAIGENISKMVTSMKPMFDMMNGVDMSGVADFFSALGSLLLKLSGGKILDFFTGGPDFKGVSDGLGDLAEGEGIKKFFAMVNTIEEEAFDKGAKLFECLDGISNLPNTGGIGQIFGGKNDYSGVAKGLGELSGEGVKNFFTMVGGLESTAFDNAKSFFESLDGISSLPNVGGIGQIFSGENDFAGVASGLTELSGKGVKNFFKMVEGLDESTFPKVKKLFNSLADISKVGKEGVFSKIKKAFSGNGKQSGLSSVATQLSNFASKTTEFFAQVNSLNLKNLNGLWKSLENSKSVTANVLKIVDEHIDSIVKKVSDLPDRMGDGLKKSGNSLGDSLVEVWKAAVESSVAPVNKVLDGANWILKQFGSKNKVIEWTPYAKGTGGHKGGNALVNDGNGAELVQMPNGRMFIPNGRNVFMPNAPRGMKVLPAEKTAQLLGKKSPSFNYADGIGDIDIWSFFDNAKGLVSKIGEGVSYAGMSDFPKNVGESMVSMFSSAMTSWVDNLFDEETLGLENYNPSKGVSQWRSTVSRALKMEGLYSDANVARTLYQMQTESGGNPKAINNWDSNAKNGTPSKGLMQVIDPTFKAYARDGFNTNIYDPLSNILASVRYATSRYGSLAKAYRGVGYSNGVGTISLPEQPASSYLSYSPESDNRYFTENSVENNTYSPVFSVTINGENNERELARKVKRWIKDSLEDCFDSIERSTR